MRREKASRGKAANRKTTVISTEAEASRRAERSGEPSPRDSPVETWGQTSRISLRGRRRWAKPCNAPRLFRETPHTIFTDGLLESACAPAEAGTPNEPPEGGTPNVARLESRL